MDGTQQCFAVYYLVSSKLDQMSIKRVVISVFPMFAVVVVVVVVVDY